MQWPVARLTTVMYPCERTDINNLSVLIHPLVTTLKLQSNGPSHTNTVTGTLAVTFGTASRGLGGAAACPGPSSLYQMQQPTHQQPVYRLRFIRCGTITAFGVWRVKRCSTTVMTTSHVAVSSRAFLCQCQPYLMFSDCCSLCLTGGQCITDRRVWATK